MSLDRRIRTSLLAIGADVALISLKSAVAWLTGSIAVSADAFHSLSDLTVSLVVLGGILLRRRAEAREAAGGPARGNRLEAAIGYGVALSILYVAFEILTRVRGHRSEGLHHLGLGVAGLALCVAIAYLASRLKLRVGRETGSPALEADGYHSRIDMLTSIAVLLAIMGQSIGIALEPVVAVAIAVLIALTGLELLASSLVALVRKSPLRPEAFEGWLRARGTPALAAILARLRVRAPGSWRPLLRRAGLAAAAVLLLAWLATGVSTVGADEIGIRTRLGAIVEARLEPGLHLHLPWPLEAVRTVPLDRIERIEIGFRLGAETPNLAGALLWDSAGGRGDRKVPEEALVLAGDENLVEVNLVLHYRLLEAVKPLYRVSRLEDVLRGLGESALREVLATLPAEAILSGDRSAIHRRIRDLLAEQADRLGLGVRIEGVMLYDLRPPLPVVPAFRDVFSAREDQLRMLNLAESYQNESLPKARSQSAGRLLDAEAYATEKALHAGGDAQRFTERALAWRLSPEVTGYRLFIETAEEGLAGRKKIIADPRANLGGYQLWLFAPEQPPLPLPLPPKPLPLPEPRP